MQQVRLVTFYKYQDCVTFQLCDSLFFVRFRLNRNQPCRATVTDTNDAGDDPRDVMALDSLSHGDLEAKTFPAIPHMPHEMAWFNVSNRTSAAL